MATDALNLVQQLKQETGNLRKLADTVSKAELTKEFGNVLEEVISTLNSVNTDLCVGELKGHRSISKLTKRISFRAGFYKA